MTAPAVSRVRVASLDRLRGLAVVLMVLDHVIVVGTDHFGIDAMPVRMTVTRLAMPLFAVVASMVWHGRPSRSTVGWLSLCVVVEWSVNDLVGVANPGPVTVLVLVMFAVTQLPMLMRWPAVTFVAGMISALYWPGPWPGYDPGLILAYWCLPHLGPAVRREADAIGGGLPGFVGAIGRRAPLWYVGHLLVLAAVVVSFG